MAEALHHFIASRYDGRNLPVTLVLPDGERVPLSAGPRRRHRRALLARLARAGLARAGFARPRLCPGRPRLHRQRTADAGRRGSDGGVGVARPRPCARATQVLAQPQARQPPEYRPSLRRVQRVLPDVAGPADGLFLRVFPGRCRFARCGAGAETRPHLPQAAARSRREIPGHRLRLGRAPVPRGRNLRRYCHRHHAVAKPVRPRDARNRGTRSRRARARRAARLSRPAGRRAVRQDRECRDVRARRRARAFPTISARFSGS